MRSTKFKCNGREILKQSLG